MITVLVALFVAWLLNRTFGWVPALVAGVAITVAGGLILRAVGRRELDKYIEEHKEIQ